MKKYVTTSLFIFWAIMVAVIVAGLVSRNDQSAFKSNIDSVNQVENVSGTNQNSDAATTNKLLTMAELAKHNSASDCWLLVSGKIYDVTSYISSHPGGAVIVPTCGTDATAAYSTKGVKGKPHSSSAAAMLENYFIGSLNQAAVISPASSKQSTTPTPTSSQKTDDNEWEYED